MQNEQLWCAVRMMRACLLSDVQECEQVNSMIKAINIKSPNIGLPLLDSRIKLKKRMMHVRSVAEKRSSSAATATSRDVHRAVTTAFSDMAKSAAEHYAEGKAIVDNEMYRYLTAPTAQIMMPIGSSVSASIVWASKLIVLFNRRRKEHRWADQLCKMCFAVQKPDLNGVVHIPQAGSEVYMCSDRHYSSWLMTVCTVQGQTQSGDVLLKVSLPLRQARNLSLYGLRICVL
jgi:hypothetical protein